jgi:putative oxidoreductase
MKIVNIILKVLLCLLMAMPILGATGVFPGPTADLYNNAQAFSFIDILMQTKYIMYIMAAVFAAAIVLIIMSRTALAALLILPITVNIIGFHAFLDGGLLTPGAIMGNLLLVLNVYFLWYSRKTYAPLWKNKN